MLHQCGHQSSTRQCSCGMRCGGGSGSGASSFSIFFPMSGCGNFGADDEGFDCSKMDISSTTSSVDCTLSLGTPSTRLGSEHKTFASSTYSSSQQPSFTPSSSFRWDFISHPKKHSSVANGGSAASNGSGNTIGSNLSGDPLLLARRCANCDTTSTPLWRNGPRGPKSLCNACGIRYKKEERRAAASAASPSSSTTSGVTAAGEQAIGYGYYRQPPQQQSPWGGCYASSTVSKSSGSISMYDDAADDGSDVPYLSWRLNLMPAAQFPVGERPSVFQYNM
ncbi:GATA transcription factor 19-like [Canna indica]|uniref:GATA transcription factor 19-like n=1 Tax=Canna indica TaxID=4628 RepID=A0AAQ3KU23_9LILI|nr:GATA transcription factor 19-like [Canna indica]